MPEKRYTEKEVKEIIRRATELQNDDLRSDLQSREGISLAELEEIGAEVGLNSSYLREAAFEQENQSVVTYSESNDTHHFEERDLAVELDESAWDELTSELRHYFGTKYGQVDEDSRRLEWTHMGLSGIETKAALTSRGDHARLRLSQRVGLAGPVTEGAMYGMSLAGLLTFFVHAYFEPVALITAGVFVGLSVIGSLGVFGLDTIWRRRKKEQLKALADKLADQLMRSGKKTGLRKKTSSENEVTEKHPEIEIPGDLEEGEAREEESGRQGGRDRSERTRS